MSSQDQSQPLSWSGPKIFTATDDLLLRLVDKVESCSIRVSKLIALLNLHTDKLNAILEEVQEEEEISSEDEDMEEEEIPKKKKKLQED